MTGDYLFDYKGGKMFVVPPVKHTQHVKIPLWERLKTFKIFTKTKEVVKYVEVIEDEAVIFNNGNFYANEATANHIKGMMKAGYKT